MAGNQKRQQKKQYLNSCILCGSNKREILYKRKRLPKSKIAPKEAVCTGEIGARGKHAKIWRCLKCGLVFQEPSFSQKELDEAYSEGVDEQYFEQLEQRKGLFRKCLKRIEKFRNPKGKLLDVGSGAGIFVHEARRSGWNAEGLDPSIWASKEAKKRFNVKVRKGTFEDFKAKPGSYDVVTMWDVLEHFTEPLEALHKANGLLKEDGVLALATVNINSWFSKLLKSHWTWLIRIHLWYFTPKTLIRMLRKAGFKVEWIGGQVRWFSTPYLLSRFTGKDFSWFPKIVLPAPTGDIIFVVARKKYVDKKKLKKILDRLQPGYYDNSNIGQKLEKLFAATGLKVEKKVISHLGMAVTFVLSKD